MRESSILKLVRLAASRLGITTFRNNVGSYRDPEGRWIQYGLAKGSSDLICWRGVRVRPEHVGSMIAVFTAIETKSRGGRLTEEQKNFLDAVERAGGIAIVARSPEDVERGLAVWETRITTR